MPRFRFNTYRTVGQEVAITADSADEARALILKGQGEDVGEKWNADHDVDVDLIPNLPDESSDE